MSSKDNDKRRELAELYRQKVHELNALRNEAHRYCLEVTYETCDEGVHVFGQKHVRIEKLTINVKHVM